MKKCRRLHLWIGLLTSLLILIEAVTGLIMSEPWLIGAGKPQTEQHVQLEGTRTAETLGKTAPALGKPVEGEAAQSGGNLLRFVKALHAGRVGNTDVSILLNVVAVGLIFITITGIILSIKTLKAQGAAKKKY